MTTTKKRRRSLAPLTSVPLRATTRSTPLHLDHAADLALHYAQAWLQRTGRVKVPASGICRRALQAYAHHLAGLPEEAQGSEFRAAESASKPFITDAAAQAAAWARLEGTGEGDPLPPFGLILRGPEAAAALAELDANVGAAWEAIEGSRWGRFLGRRRGPEGANGGPAA